MDLLVEQRLVIAYQSGTSNKTVDFFLRFSQHDSADKVEEDELALAVAHEGNGLVPFTEAVKTFLFSGTLSSIDKELYSCGGRRAKNFIDLV